VSAPGDPSVLSIAFLGSGSSGNCAVVRCGRTAVLVDAGLSARETKRRLALCGVALEDVAAVFLTHEHADHVHGALALSRKAGLTVYATAGTADAAGFPGPLFADVRTVRGGRDLVVGELHVRVTSTPHDGVESVCYVFADGAGRRVGMATDLGHLSRPVLEALRDCDALGLEANHDEDLLREGPYPAVLKRRILSDVGHLSNESAAEALKALVGARTRSVTALHVSRHNNTYPLAERVFREALAELGATAALAVARHDVPTEWKKVSEEAA
jgi:phosphoribosyl 1,2-cyclic phosphodiesterase